MATLNETFFVADLASDFDDITCDAILEDFQSLSSIETVSGWVPTILQNDRQSTYLLHRHTSGKQLDKITGLENCGWVISLPGGLHSHATLYQIQSTRDPLLFQSPCYKWPCFLQVNFTVFREESSERGFLGEATSDIILGFEWLDLVADSTLEDERISPREIHEQQTFHLSMSSVSHGLSLLYVDGILEDWVAQPFWQVVQDYSSTDLNWPPTFF